MAPRTELSTQQYNIRSSLVFSVLSFRKQNVLDCTAQCQWQCKIPADYTEKRRAKQHQCHSCRLEERPRQAHTQTLLALAGATGTTDTGRHYRDMHTGNTDTSTARHSTHSMPTTPHSWAWDRGPHLPHQLRKQGSRSTIHTSNLKATCTSIKVYRENTRPRPAPA